MVSVNPEVGNVTFVAGDTKSEIRASLAKSTICVTSTSESLAASLEGFKLHQRMRPELHGVLFKFNVDEPAIIRNEFGFKLEHYTPIAPHGKRMSSRLSAQENSTHPTFLATREVRPARDVSTQESSPTLSLTCTQKFGHQGDRPHPQRAGGSIRANDSMIMIDLS
ncbi:hypothetical protein L210DRAFT_3500758 [Boletus edulis BED1]|uniref:Uncharacterized protein n=1 Tax=Boletus edulis BED1 TaxID=1328754 RepID=A0AAD4GKD8_BOLED|nr:hypothetical protein L210DRAFT_3500758 [Boletus edulis BED1]